MKRLLVIFSSVLLFASCKKDNECGTAKPTIVASAGETTYLQNYLTANSLTAASINGMFYNITNPGSGNSPNLCSTVNVTYSGYLINGTSTASTPFDSATTPTALSLSGVIDGWQLVMPLVKTGGSVTLYVPPSLAYGTQAQTNSSGNVVIPANSYLKFVITLVSVN